MLSDLFLLNRKVYFNNLGFPENIILLPTSGPFLAVSTFYIGSSSCCSTIELLKTFEDFPQSSKPLKLGLSLRALVVPLSCMVESSNLSSEPLFSSTTYRTVFDLYSYINIIPLLPMVGNLTSFASLPPSGLLMTFISTSQSSLALLGHCLVFCVPLATCIPVTITKIS